MPNEGCMRTCRTIHVEIQTCRDYTQEESKLWAYFLHIDSLVTYILKADLPSITLTKLRHSTIIQRDNDKGFELCK